MPATIVCHHAFRRKKSSDNLGQRDPKKLPYNLPHAVTARTRSERATQHETNGDPSLSRVPRFCRLRPCPVYSQSLHSPQAFTPAAGLETLLGRPKGKMSDTPHVVTVFVGSYTESLPHVHGKAVGPHVVSLRTSDGHLSACSADGIRLEPPVKNPSYLAVSSDARRLYVVEEAEDLNSKLVVLDIVASDQSNGVAPHLLESCRLETGGAGACHVAELPASSGRLVAFANYAGGTGFGIMTVDSLDGSLQLCASQTVVPSLFSGSFAGGRQERSHPHCVVFSPLNPHMMVVADLGTNEIYSFVIRSAGGLEHVSSARAHATGAGPRHIVFHGSVPIMYVVNELDSTVAAYSYSPEDGSLARAPVSVTGTMPPVGASSASSTAAAIRIHPNNSVLYVSNRGHDSISVFALSADGREMSLLSCVPSGGRTPRDIWLVSSADWMLVANQDTDSVVSFRVSPCGTLLHQAFDVHVKTPVCVASARLGA
ncbi:6-phosphogluconolactonase [Porphyridium purpureum]|uniref:6-phosphogluconolactonase n=1 Tax=Porphyridium purpureum TaxID=35688 RepID=A0A5J4YR55_PORPP|nr:6-phosphogluconolactonase [Porphyridium purpureum]|eukprot:POR5505..scf236_6